MANSTFQLKRTSVPGRIPKGDQIEVGELAINLADAKLFSKDGSNTIIQIGGSGGSNNLFVATVDSFTGNGTANTFALSVTPNTENYTIVSVGGVYQHKDTYSISGSNVVFSEAPANSEPIEVITYSGEGTKGDKGDTGSKGDKGEVGSKGDKGEVGEKGDKGDTGSKGDKGEVGSKGDKGDLGDKGDKGDTGSKGDKGDTGSKGDKGEVGEKGQKGERTSSASYSDGNNTVVFTNSDTSTYSITGIKGQKGEVGSKGDKGEIGTPGGSNTTVLFNDSGNSNGVIELTFNKDTDTLHIGNNTVNTTINATHVSVKSIFANSSNGSSGQALFSNGTGIYWANIVGGATLVANSTDTQEFYIPMANATTGSWTNGVVDTVLTFVPSLDRLSLGNTTVNTQVNTTSIKTTSFIDNNGNKLIIRDSSNNVVWGG